MHNTDCQMCSLFTWNDLVLFVLLTLCFCFKLKASPQPNTGGVCFFCPPPAPLKPVSVSKLLNQNVSLNVNCLQNGRRNQPGVCMKTQARWLMLLPLPALMALIFSSAERSQGLRCQMRFCSPPFTGFTRAAARERFTSCFIRRAWWIHSFEEVTLQNESEVRFYSRHPSQWNINEGICKLSDLFLFSFIMRPPLKKLHLTLG